MGVGVTLAVVVMSGGFMAARAFRSRRFERSSNAGRERLALNRRRHHFRGSLDLEVVKGPLTEDANRRDRGPLD
jgi:hypothetical protein